jgi:hypothetical protein
MKALLRVAALVAAFAFALGLAGATAPLDSGPTTLTMAYHTAPGDRMALKDYMQATGLKQFAGWREQGIIKDYRVYWSRYADSLNWDMLVVLQFADTKHVSEWRKVEARFPAGLPVSVAKLCTAIHTNPADLHFSAGEPSPTAVFLIIPYDYLVSTAEYLKYVKSYITPQYDGWIGERVLASYQIYLGRFPVSRYWSALMILEYRDEEALGVREQTSNKVRAKLRENAEWKAIHESKQNVRVTRQYVMADLLK